MLCCSCRFVTWVQSPDTALNFHMFWIQQSSQASFFGINFQNSGLPVGFWLMEAKSPFWRSKFDKHTFYIHLKHSKSYFVEILLGQLLILFPISTQQILRPASNISVHHFWFMCHFLWDFDHQQSNNLCRNNRLLSCTSCVWLLNISNKYLIPMTTIFLVSKHVWGFRMTLINLIELMVKHQSKLQDCKLKV